MTIQGINLDRYKKGDTIAFRRRPRFERNYSKFLRFEPDLEDVVLFTVGVSTLAWLEAELRRRVYRPMIATRFDPARLPA